ncbi:MAG: methionine adenosyltransferase [bacterium]|nr:methionine adenosyltransferase [bacterium]MCP4799952.1 methionine adenosyltransferase [bacterium]
MKKHLFTSESVTEGHPDKVADQVSDAILDAMLADDPESRVACETMVTTGMAIVAGEVTTETYVEIPELVRGVIKDIGYTSSEFGFDSETCAVLLSLDKQSPDISRGLIEDAGHEQGAGDQGLMFGYACRETDVLMPLPITLSHRLAMRLADARKDGTLPWACPDGKTQATVLYEDGFPKALDTLVVSTMHTDNVEQPEIREAVIESVIKPVIAEFDIDSDDLKIHINPTGRFVIGGPQGDCGLTGRKIIVDTYGGSAPHGGGAFSGKDPSKVDRSATYAARYVAKNIVAAELADRCQVQVAYAIGVAEPVSLMVDTFGTGKRPDKEIADIVAKLFDLTPKGIITKLDLKRAIYRATAAYGHFGREEETFTWEKTDMVDQLQAML